MANHRCDDNGQAVIVPPKQAKPRVDSAEAVVREWLRALLMSADDFAALDALNVEPSLLEVRRG